MTSKDDWRGEKIAEDVYLDGTSRPGHKLLRHQCVKNEWPNLMLLRENEDGPLYWCQGCGYVLDEGVSMAIRLNEVDI